MKQFYIFILSICPFILLGQQSITASITPDLTGYEGAVSFPGQGEYEVFSGGDQDYDKPIFLIDGFDPGDTRDITSFYNSLDYGNSQNLLDDLRAEGFDIVILNFPTYMNNGNDVDGGADFIERNALILVELIEVINGLKADMTNPEENVIIGPSMGGLISRYALNYMESESMDADTRLWVSFDSPHLGANIPIGFQHLLNYLAFNELVPNEELQPLITDFLDTPAARQLLIDHYRSHLLDGSSVEFDPSKTIPAPDSYRVQFESNISALTPSGFPDNVRKISIVNGSGIGSSYFAIGDSGAMVTNGYTIIDTTIPIDAPPFVINIEIDINFTPDAGSAEQVSRFFAPNPIPVLPDVESVAFSERPNFDGVDAAPGGLYEITDFAGGLGSSDGPAGDFFDALQIDKFSFIPTVSALALEITNGEVDWFHNIDLDGFATTNNTPFDDTYIPDDNEGHVEITSANVNFLLFEILSPSLSLPNQSKDNISLVSNPISSEFVINSLEPIDATVELMDMCGKLLFTTKKKIENNTSFNISLSNGLYILRITDNKSNSSFVERLVVNK
ncbi:MAG: T9SS type A sorting domain-containing protein [Bacteroidota bacterium]